jgi:hypothetical protein
VRNYFNYFTEIEEHFQRRRGTLLLLSTLDWALIETWRDAGVPLEAVLRGIDAAFDKHESRPAKSSSRRVNGLAWCAQAVMEAAEDIQQASIGMAKPAATTQAQGFEHQRIAAWLTQCADTLEAAQLEGLAAETAHDVVLRLRELATEAPSVGNDLESLERNLLVLEEKLMTVILATTPEADLIALKEESARELAPYRRRMQAVQIRQIEAQFLHKRLVDKHKLPRLSLFYMSQA